MPCSLLDKTLRIDTEIFLKNAMAVQPRSILHVPCIFSAPIAMVTGVLRLTDCYGVRGIKHFKTCCYKKNNQLLNINMNNTISGHIASAFHFLVIFISYIRS